MRLDKAAHAANILALFPAGYCAYVAWVTQSSQQQHNQGAAEMVNSKPLLLISIGAFAGLFVLGAVLSVIALLRKQRSPSVSTNGEGAPKSPVSPQSLYDRTMNLRRELRAFLREVGPTPDLAREPGEDGAEYVKRRWAASKPWVDKMMHGFELRFRERMRLLLHEYGERSIYDQFLGEAVEKPVNTDTLTEEMIEHLGMLALKVDEL